jgi:hypothetical protein
MVAVLLSLAALSVVYFFSGIVAPDNGDACEFACFGQTVFNFSNNSIYWTPISGSLFLFGCYLLAHYLPIARICQQSDRRWTKLITLLLTSLLILLVFGKDTAVWSFLAAMNLAVLSGEVYERKFAHDKFLLALPVSILCFMISGIFSTPANMLAGLLLYLSGSRRGASMVAVSFCFCLVMGVVSPTPELPAYPPGAEVVPSYNTVDGLTPFIGDQLPIRSVNLLQVRERIVSLLPVMAIVLLVLGLALSKLPFLPSLLLFSVLFDSALLTPFYAQMMPISSLSRILPGGQFYPISFLALSGFLSIIGTEMQSAGQRSLLRSQLCAAFLFASCLLCGGSSRRLFLPESDLRLRDEVLLSDPNVKKVPAGLVESPSYFVAQFVGLKELEKRNNRRNPVFVPVGDALQSVLSYSGPVDFSVLSDGKSATGWHTDQPFQFGNEWLEISLKEPISAIRLYTGDYFSDFPRGVKISFLERCPAAHTGWKNAPTALILPQNYGDIAVTNDGYPYFEQQYALSAFLPDALVANCILVQQTGRDDHYAWTVADITIVPAEKKELEK